MSFKFFMSIMVFVKQSGELIFPPTRFLDESSWNGAYAHRIQWLISDNSNYVRHFSERILIGAKININLTTHGWRDKEKHAQSWLNLWTFIKQPVARSHVLNVIFQDAGVLFFFYFLPFVLFVRFPIVMYPHEIW